MGKGHPGRRRKDSWTLVPGSVGTWASPSVCPACGGRGQSDGCPVWLSRQQGGGCQGRPRGAPGCLQAPSCPPGRAPGPRACVRSAPAWAWAPGCPRVTSASGHRVASAEIRGPGRPGAHSAARRRAGRGGGRMTSWHGRPACLARAQQRHRTHGHLSPSCSKSFPSKQWFRNRREKWVG